MTSKPTATIQFDFWVVGYFFTGVVLFEECGVEIFLTLVALFVFHDSCQSLASCMILLDDIYLAFDVRSLVLVPHIFVTCILSVDLVTTLFFQFIKIIFVWHWDLGG